MARLKGYSSENTEITQAVLMEVTSVLGTYVERGDIVLVGGFLPFLFAKASMDPNAPVHIGTSDVDLLLDARIIRDDAYQTIRKALEDAGFVESKEQPSTFGKDVKDASGGTVTVAVDLLGPRYMDKGTGRNRRHQRVRRNLMIRKLDGGDFALENTAWIELSGKRLDGTKTAHRIRIPSLGAFIVLKGLVVGNRESKSKGPEKDAYDLYYVIGFLTGGPSAAAKAVVPLMKSKTAQRAIDNIKRKFSAPDSVGVVYAARMLAGLNDTMFPSHVERVFLDMQEFLSRLRP